MKKIVITIILLFTILTSTVLGIFDLVKANPIENDIIVDSPLEDTIYNSTEVALKFRVMDQYQTNYTYPNDVYGHNFTSFSYSLDGHQFIETNGESILRDLTNGSHTLKIYGAMPFTNGTIWFNNSIHPTIHFDVFYHSISLSDDFPTIPVTASVSAIVLGIAGLLVYSKKHKHRVENT